MRAEPVKYSAGPLLDGCEPLRAMVSVCDSLLEAAEGAYDPDPTLAWFIPTHAEASRDSDMTVALSSFISVLSSRHSFNRFAPFNHFVQFKRFERLQRFELLEPRVLEHTERSVARVVQRGTSLIVVARASEATIGSTYCAV
jgi:hypothetical protein